MTTEPAALNAERRRLWTLADLAEGRGDRRAARVFRSAASNADVAYAVAVTLDFCAACEGMRKASEDLARDVGFAEAKIHALLARIGGE